MDSLASRDPNFKIYVESVLGSDNSKACQTVRYGVSKSGQRFALVLVYSLYYYVHMVIEPSGEGICIDPIVPYASFDNRDSAIAYMEEKGLELSSSKQKLDDVRDFGIFVTEKLKPIWGQELYRIHDFDTVGNPFIIVLKKWFIYYKVVTFTTQNDEPQTKTEIGREGAEEYLQNIRNKLKGIGETYELVYRLDVDKKWLNFDETPELSEGMQLLTPNTYISDTILKDKPKFAAFVEKSVLSSFRGEEAYRKYGVTLAGQHFCYVVSKIDYYIVHVVLEPSSGSYNTELEAIVYFSWTWHLTKVKERDVIDKFVTREIEQFVNRSGRSLLFASVHMQYQQLDFLITNEQELESLGIRRGNHLRRNLNVGILSPTYHDGIYLGNGKVAHYTTDNSAGFLRSKGGSGPDIVSLETFLHGENTLTVQYRLILSRSRKHVAEVAEYLISNKVWDKRYNLVKRNCQLFAELCTVSTSEYMLEQGHDVEEFKTMAKKFLQMTLMLAVLFIFAWFICGFGLHTAIYSLILNLIPLLMTLCGAIMSITVGTVWWIQKKSLEETLQIFTEIENGMALEGSTEEGCHSFPCETTDNDQLDCDGPRRTFHCRLETRFTSSTIHSLCMLWLKFFIYFLKLTLFVLFLSFLIPNYLVVTRLKK